MNKFYLVELIEYYYDSKEDYIDQEVPQILGLYTTKEEYKARVQLEIDRYKKASKTEVEVYNDEELVEGCIEVLDIVSKEARVTMIVTKVNIGDSNKKIDYNRINYFVDYDKSGEFDEVMLEIIEK